MSVVGENVHFKVGPFCFGLFILSDNHTQDSSACRQPNNAPGTDNMLDQTLHLE